MSLHLPHMAANAQDYQEKVEMFILAITVC